MVAVTTFALVVAIILTAIAALRLIRVWRWHRAVRRLRTAWRDVASTIAAPMLILDQREGNP